MKKLLIVMTALMLVMGFAFTASAGDYYEFSTFSGSGVEYDVACYGNDIYYGSGRSIAKVTVSVTDPSKVNEPKMYDHDNNSTTPDVSNPNYQTRTFLNETLITLNNPAGTSLYGGSAGEMWVDSTGIYTLGRLGSLVSDKNQVFRFDHSGNYLSTVVTPATYVGADVRMLSYDSDSGTWYGANENAGAASGAGAIYSSTGGDWTYMFDSVPTAGGSHLDGLEYINGKIWTSDMTSQFLQEYSMTGTLLNQYAYTGGVSYVEGMGYGALTHFWVGDGSKIYELGGGLVKPDEVVPEPATMLLLGSGLLGLAGLSRKKKISKKS